MSTTTNRLEKKDEKRLTVIWEQGADAKSLTFLKSPAADGKIRSSIRMVKGPQPYKHNHYTDHDFYRHDPARGVLTSVYGTRVVRVSEDFIVAVLGGLEDEVGDAAGEIMYKCGYEWGIEDMKSFVTRVQAEFEVELAKMPMSMMLETWWWPLQIEGWGGWHFDFRQAKQGLIFIDLFESAVAKSIGDVGKVVCHFYAGLFAAVFSVLAKRPLACIEIQCYAMGEDFCKFLVSSEKRVNAAGFWRNEGATSKEIMKKLAESEQ